MNVTKRTDMNTQKQSQKIIFCVAGIAFFLFTIFPQTLWASSQDSLTLSRVLEVLELVLGDRANGSYRNSFAEGQYYRGDDRYREYRPVVNKDYRENRRPAYYSDRKNPGHYRKHSRKHHHPKHKYCNENRHRQQYYNDRSWR